MSLFLARLAGIPKRIAFYRRSSHGFNPDLTRLLYAWFINRLVYTNATAILSNSQHALDFFFGSRAERSSKFRIISNGVDSGRFNATLPKEEARSNLGLPSESFIVGHVGRYDPAKNHTAIFETGRLLKERIPSLRLLFCGGGTDSDAFRQAMAPYNIDDVVVALGTRNDVEVVFRALDVFYFPSITEGQPNALLEAMLCGLPILASNIDPIADIIPEAYRGNLLIDAHATGEAAERIYAHYAGECNSVSLIEYASITFDLTRNFELLYNEL